LPRRVSEVGIFVALRVAGMHRRAPEASTTV